MLLLDPKQRRYLINLRAGASFHTHVGIVAHDDLIGVPEGSTVSGSTGRQFLVVRPTLSDTVLKMPRGAQVIYPKDLGAILIEADIAPGSVVLEAGVGSGALSMALLRAGAEVIGYELREDFAERAVANVTDLLGSDATYRVRAARCVRGYRGAGPGPGPARPSRTVARPAPCMRWRCGQGGIICAYLPSINQTSQFRNALDRSRFGMAVDARGAASNLAHRGPFGPTGPPDGGPHTGFLTTARLLVPPEPAPDEEGAPSDGGARVGDGAGAPGGAEDPS